MFLPLRDVTCPSTTEARRWQRCTMAFSRVSNGVPEFVSTLPYDLEVWEGKSVTRTTEDCEKWHPNRERVGEISERFWMPLERWFSIFEDMLMVNWQQSENGYCNVMSIIYVDSMIYIYIYNYKTSVSWMVQYRMPIILVEIEISGYSILSILCIWVLSSGFMLLSTCTLYNSKSLSIIFHIFSLNLKTRTTLHKVSPTLQDPTESRGHCEVTWCGRVKWLLIMLLI